MKDPAEERGRAGGELGARAPDRQGSGPQAWRADLPGPERHPRGHRLSSAVGRGSAAGDPRGGGAGRGSGKRRPFPPRAKGDAAPPGMTDLLRSLTGPGLATPSGEERPLPPGLLGGETPQGGLAAGSRRPGFEASGAPSCQVACRPVTAHESGGGWGPGEGEGGAEGESGLRRMRPQPGRWTPPRPGQGGRVPWRRVHPPDGTFPFLPSRPLLQPPQGQAGCPRLRGAQRV